MKEVGLETAEEGAVRALPGWGVTDDRCKEGRLEEDRAGPCEPYSDRAFQRWSWPDLVHAPITVMSCFVLTRWPDSIMLST